MPLSAGISIVAHQHGLVYMTAAIRKSRSAGSKATCLELDPDEPALPGQIREASEVSAVVRNLRTVAGRTPRYRLATYTHDDILSCILPHHMYGCGDSPGILSFHGAPAGSRPLGH